MSDTANKFGPTIGAGSAATLYTAPSGGAVLRQLHICNTSNGAVTFKMSIGADAAGTRLYGDYSIAANDTLDWTGFLPFTSAETLQWTAAATLTVRGGVIEL